ncbi:hypothetical protein Cgig2_019563 [Carnegiea gigantea]|uniref:Elongator complex protein 4 n=1 Tax=Carnegiea gigantea TaxID=171969 RepID=A0A9Q1QJA7_9CARY|nr:hypothetical protein Cgig2_019563 [Carnegiea gigantea]
MATTTRPRTSSFSRNPLAGPTSQVPGLKPGPNGSVFISSGIPDLDRILGGGFCLGSLVMVMEDPEAPHHMLLLRNFMAQGLVHNQPLLYASPAKDPKGFLGTLPNPISSKDEKPRDHAAEQDKGLRIAWQYKKYFGENQQGHDSRDAKHEYCNDFDLRKPLERQFLGGKNIICVSTIDLTLETFRERCRTFLAQNSRNNGVMACASRIAIQSFCAPQCGYFDKHSEASKKSSLVPQFVKFIQLLPLRYLGVDHLGLLLSFQDWDMLAFIKSLKGIVQSSNSVAIITLKQFQACEHFLLSICIALPLTSNEDKELAKLLTGYQEMVGLLSIHKVARINTQVPLVLEASTFSIKLHKRRSLVLECLNQAPIDGSTGASYGTSGSCSGSTKQGALDF